MKCEGKGGMSEGRDEWGLTGTGVKLISWQPHVTM